MISEPIVLKPELRDFLETSAQQEDKSVNEVINEALEYYFRAKQEEKLSREIEAFEAMHRELWEKLPYQWVAIHNQTLVDHDTDDVALFRRIRARYGRVSILLRQVRETPNPEIWIRTPSTGKRPS